jgi:hypothetical protein
MQNAIPVQAETPDQTELSGFDVVRQEARDETRAELRRIFSRLSPATVAELGAALNQDEDDD